MDIKSIENSLKPISWSVGTKTENNTVKTFSDTLKDAIDEVKNLYEKDQNNTELLATGQVENLHQIMIDAEKADIALQFMLQTRNKALEAYQEIMRMQI
ncbi:MAG TPA: flagellar hook-basal body complex protein FliE [Clostridiales bacterium]|nr:flagellar hook-basal body complex protein FliE [Clostridiales bacterium]